MKKICSLIVTLLVCCLLFASCSSSSANTGSATPNVDAIKKKGELTILTNPTFPPFEYIGKAGRVEGIDVDIATEIAKDMGVSVKTINLDFDFLVDSLKSGKGDIIAAAMTVTDERKEQVDFTDKYVTSAQYAVVPVNSSIDIERDKDKLTFAAQEGTKGEFYAVDELGANTLLFKTATDCSQALLSGKVDVSIMDDLVAKNIVNRNSDSLKLIDKPLTSESYAFAVAKGKQDLLDQINSTIKRITEDGTLKQIEEKHMNIK